MPFQSTSGALSPSDALTTTRPPLLSSSAPLVFTRPPKTSLLLGMAVQTA